MGWFQEESRRYTEAKEAMDRAALASERSAAREVAQLRRRAMAAAVAEDPAVAAAAAAAGAGLGDSSSQSISSSPSKSSASDDLGELPRHGIARGEEASPTPTGSQEPGRRDDSSVMQPHSLAGVHRTTAVLPPSSGSRTAEQTSGSSDMSRPHHLVLHESATESGEGPSVGGSDSVAVSRTRPEPEPQQPPFLANYRWGSPTRSASSVAASSVTLTPNMSAAARYAEETLAALGATASPSAQRGDSSVPSSLDGPSNLSERLAALGIDTGAPISPRSFSGGDQQLARPALSGSQLINIEHF